MGDLKKDGNEKQANALFAKHFKPHPGHAWYFEGMNREQLEKVSKGFEERSSKGALK